MRHEIVELLGFGSQNTYYSWKKEQRPIIDLLEKYCTKEDLKEFLSDGKISKFDECPIKYITLLISVKLNVREKALLHFIVQELQPKNQTDLVKKIDEFELNDFQKKQLSKQFSDFIKLKIIPDPAHALAFTSDLPKLSQFIKELNKNEIEIWLRNPNFEFYA